MNYNFMKKTYEKTPYFIKAPFAGIIRRRLIKNKTFVEQYAKLEKLDYDSEEQLEKEQLDSLRDTLIHAYEHTVYYHRIFDEIAFNPYMIKKLSDIYVLPLLTKEDLKKHFDELTADDITDSYIVTTGGTSGKPITVLMENKAIYREWAFVYHFWAKFGYDYKKNKLATFRGVNLGNKICEINPLYQEIRMNPFILNGENIGLYLERIHLYGADFIYGYPSAIYNFCKLAQNNGIVLLGKFKATFLISENLYPFQEAIITEVLGCPIGMFYGHSERAVFGEKCGKGYYLNPIYGVTEISPKGEPIVTGFINKKMPLIRYVVDDTISLINDEEYKATSHRDPSVIYGKDGSEVKADLVDLHGLVSEKVASFQLVQTLPGKLIIRVVGEEILTQGILDDIRKKCELRLGTQFSIQVEAVTELEPSASRTQKYKLLIQNTVGTLTKLSEVYKIVGHHDAEVLYGKNGEEISVAAINFHNNTFNAVDSYQFVQDVPGECVLRIVPANILSEIEIEKIKKNVESKLGTAFKCNIKVVDEILFTSRGKFRMLIQNWKG